MAPKKKSTPKSTASIESSSDPVRDAAAEIRQNAHVIVTPLIEKAKSGSYLHAKFLFEFAGLTAPPPADSVDGSLAALLLRALELEP